MEPRNRAERRALERATKKKKHKKQFLDNLKIDAKKLAYIAMIEKLRKLNEQIKEEEEKKNEGTN